MVKAGWTCLGIAIACLLFNGSGIIKAFHISDFLIASLIIAALALWVVNAMRKKG